MVRPRNALPFENLQDKPYGCRWACRHNWEQSSRYTLRLYRDQLDGIRENEFVWLPYALQALPWFCVAGIQMWTSNVMLIFCDISEMYYPGRFCRQFRAMQHVPPVAESQARHHASGAKNSGWPLTLWEERHTARRHTAIEFVDEPTYTPAYREWYKDVGKRRICNPLHGRPTTGYAPTNRETSTLMQCMGDIYRRMAAPFDVEDIREQIARCLTGLGAENVLHEDIILFGDAHDDAVDAHPPLRQDLRKDAPTRGRRFGRGYVDPHVEENVNDDDDDGDNDNHDDGDDNDYEDDDGYDDDDEEDAEDGGEEGGQPSSYVHSHIPSPTYNKVVQLFADRRRAGQMWRQAGFRYPQNIWKDILEHSQQRHRCTIVPHNLSTGIYSVSISDYPPVTVNLSRCECDCGFWKQNGFPCVHAYATCHFLEITVYHLIPDVYKLGAYIRTYASDIMPMHDVSAMPDTGYLVIPPQSARRGQTGRPQKTRFT
ncbi:unnamed protein product, partial [Cuscuta epithymum]